MPRKRRGGPRQTARVSTGGKEPRVFLGGKGPAPSDEERERAEGRFDFQTGDAQKEGNPFAFPVPPSRSLSPTFGSSPFAFSEAAATSALPSNLFAFSASSSTSALTPNLFSFSASSSTSNLFPFGSFSSAAASSSALSSSPFSFGSGTAPAMFSFPTAAVPAPHFMSLSSFGTNPFLNVPLLPLIPQPKNINSLPFSMPSFSASAPLFALPSFSASAPPTSLSVPSSSAASLLAMQEHIRQQVQLQLLNSKPSKKGAKFFQGIKEKKSAKRKAAPSPLSLQLVTEPEGDTSEKSTGEEGEEGEEEEGKEDLGSSFFLSSSPTLSPPVAKNTNKKIKLDATPSSSPSKPSKAAAPVVKTMCPVLLGTALGQCPVKDPGHLAMYFHKQPPLCPVLDIGLDCPVKDVGHLSTYSHTRPERMADTKKSGDKIGELNGPTKDEEENGNEEDQESKVEKKERKSKKRESSKKAEEAPKPFIPKKLYPFSGKPLPKEKLKIVACNVAGVRAAVKKGLPKFLAEEAADIACLTETKSNYGGSTLDLSSLGYDNIYWNDGETPGYAGTAIVSKVEAENVIRGIGSESDAEGRAVTLEFKNFYLVLTYVPNSGEGLKFEAKRQKWDEDMRKHLHSLQEGTKPGTSGRPKPVIWTGDLNVAHRDDDVYDGPTNKKREKSAGFTPGERKRFGVLLDEGLVDAYMSVNKDTQNGAHHTFWTMRTGAKAKNQGWRLDYFVVSPEVLPNVKGVEVRRKENFSDHAPLVLTLG